MRLTALFAPYVFFVCVNILLSSVTFCGHITQRAPSQTSLSLTPTSSRPLYRVHSDALYQWFGSESVAYIHLVLHSHSQLFELHTLFFGSTALLQRGHRPTITVAMGPLCDKPSGICDTAAQFYLTVLIVYQVLWPVLIFWFTLTLTFCCLLSAHHASGKVNE